MSVNIFIKDLLWYLAVMLKLFTCFI